MLTPNDKRIAFWLIPAEDDFIRLKQIVETYAERLGTPSFDPHLTLLARPLAAKDNPEDELEQLAKIAAPFALTGSGVPQWGPLYNQAFVLPFQNTPELAALVEQLHPLQVVPDDYFPHISLIYANLAPELGQELVQGYKPDSRTVRFDRIAAIRIGPGCACDDDVRSWETVTTVQLAQKET